MTHTFQHHHSDMDRLPAGRQAVIQIPGMDLSLPSLALDTRFPASMTRLCII
ncbi:MAG: hypothetical protein PHY16_12640 [Methylobacter sp.]|nr:hypothetical protein [Methylobacter sp.]